VQRFENLELIIVTCFSVSCINSRDDTDDTTAVRTTEDDAYARSVDARIVRLGFADSNVRSNVGRESLDPDSERQLRAELCAKLKNTIPDDALLFAPLAIGDHPDHVHCREAARAEFPSAVFYEDLPYAGMIGGPRAVDDYVAEAGFDLRCRLLMLSEREKSRKHSRFDHYRSQIHPSWRTEVDNYGAALGHDDLHGERFWATYDLSGTLPATASEPRASADAPLIFIHYGDSYYLKHSLAAAVAFNPDKEIILLGDAANAHHAIDGVEHIAFDDFSHGALIERFNEVFQYIAGDEQQREAWTRFVFQRWFLIHRFLVERKNERFWTFDSDTLIVTRLSQYESQLEDYDCTEQCSGICMNGFIASVDVVRNYLEKMIELFTRPSFLRRQRAKLKDRPTYAFTEMAAYVQYREESAVRSAWLGRIVDGETFLDCLCTVNEHRVYLNDDEYELSGETIWGNEVKKVYLGSDGTVYCRHLKSDRLIRLNTINMSWLPGWLFADLLNHAKRQLRYSHWGWRTFDAIVDWCTKPAPLRFDAQPHLPEIRPLRLRKVD